MGVRHDLPTNAASEKFVETYLMSANVETVHQRLQLGK